MPRRHFFVVVFAAADEPAADFHFAFFFQPSFAFLSLFFSVIFISLPRLSRLSSLSALFFFRRLRFFFRISLIISHYFHIS